MRKSPTHAAIGRRQPAWPSALAAMVMALAMPFDSVAQQLPGGHGEVRPPGDHTLNNTNEIVVVFPAHCCDSLRFMPGTTELAPAAEAAIRKMARLQSAAPAGRNTVRLLVLADPKLSAELAARQTAGRASTLSKALVAAGIPAQKVEVYPPTPRALKLPLSYPPIR